MTKNVFDLITAIVSAVEIAADGIFTYMAATGKLDAETAVAWAGFVTIIGGAVLGVCARFIPEGEQKKLAKK
jgi:hypothetical protein